MPKSPGTWRSDDYGGGTAIIKGKGAPTQDNYLHPSDAEMMERAKAIEASPVPEGFTRTKASSAWKNDRKGQTSTGRST